MTRIKLKPKTTQPVGKHPTRVPLTSRSPPPLTTSQTQAWNSKTTTKPRPPSAHRMTTRSRAKNFQFLALPPEIRNLIYELVFASAEQPLDLGSFKLSRLLLLTSVLRAEALPLFFSASTFKATFRSNWCVRNEHFHSIEYIRHSASGILDLSKFLRDGVVGLPKEAMRFHNVNFSVRCVCCIQVLEIGSLELRVVNGKPILQSNAVRSNNLATKRVWPRMIESVQQKVKKIGERPLFNGFTISDLEELAMCFRHDEEREGYH